MGSGPSQARCLPIRTQASTGKSWTTLAEGASARLGDSAGPHIAPQASAGVPDTVLRAGVHEERKNVSCHPKP